MKLASAAFQDNGLIPVDHTADGTDVSPPLSVTGAPAGTKFLALIVDDPDAPAGTWVHWVLYDWPVSRAAIERGQPKDAALGNGAKQGACWGVERFERVGWWGPSPPPGKPHRYVFTLYALSAPTGLAPRAAKADVLDALEGKVLGDARLIGLYGR